MSTAQRASPKPRGHSTRSVGRFLLFAPIAGYWLLAAIAVVVRPNMFELFMLGLPLVVLSIVVCARARQRERSD
jgi:hypothetical protein